MKHAAIDYAKDLHIGVYAQQNRIASYKYIQVGVTEITLMGGDDDIYFVGHINQLEKAEGICWHFVETGDISSSVYGIAPYGDCRCELCRKVRDSLK